MRQSANVATVLKEIFKSWYNTEMTADSWLIAEKPFV